MRQLVAAGYLVFCWLLVALRFSKWFSKSSQETVPVVDILLVVVKPLKHCVFWENNNYDNNAAFGNF